MGTRVLGLASDLFSVDPRPRSLAIEGFISTFAFLDIVIQFILYTYLMTDKILCNEQDEDIPEAFTVAIQAKPPLHEYVALVCGTQIRMDAWPFFLQKFIFIVFFCSIFYINKYFIRRINRLHALVMGENIPEYIKEKPVYTNVNYRKRWRRSLIDFMIYKGITIVLLCMFITSSFLVIHLIPSVNDFLSYEGNECGPKMDYVEDIGLTMVCHFQDEFIIRLLSWASHATAIVVMLLFCASLVGLLVYAIRFRHDENRNKNLDEQMITYEHVDHPNTKGKRKLLNTP